MSDWKKRNEDWRDEDELLYAHTQNKPRLELTEKIEADFYTQDVAGEIGRASCRERVFALV